MAISAYLRKRYSHYTYTAIGFLVTKFWPFMRLDEKVAMVTGGGRGMGRATAIRMAQEGAKVVVVDKAQDTATSTADRIKEEGGQAIVIAADVTRSEEVQRMVQTLL